MVALTIPLQLEIWNVCAYISFIHNVLVSSPIPVVKGFFPPLNYTLECIHKNGNTRSEEYNCFVTLFPSCQLILIICPN